MATCIQVPRVQKVAPMLYEVQSFTRPGTYYVVDVLEQTCTCPQFKYRGARCKHLELVYTQVWEERGEYHA